MKNNPNESFSIMGVLNITPDSYSDGGKYLENPVARALELSLEGADIIDVGAESTGPNSKAISVAEEISRLDKLFTTEKFLELKTQVDFSVDTYKAEVAEYALTNGVKIINDVSALRNHDRMAKIISEYGSEVVLMFSKEDGHLPHVSSKQLEFESIISSIVDFFEERLEYALGQGIQKSKIILDPGMGAFLGKDPRYSWEVVNSIKFLKDSFPEFRMLCGVSRKSFIASLVNPDNLDVASKVVELSLINSEIDIVRTHNVKLLKDLIPINANAN